MKTKSFIIFIIVVILAVGGLGLYMSSRPSQYDGFAKALKEKGALFYGAFWCPHCQEQKAEFGTSKKYLPYIECSNPDNTQTQVCIDKKIESYPTWMFKDGIKLISSTEPVICPILKEGASPDGNCANSSSSYYRSWVFGEYKFSIKSPTDPIKTGDTWQFPAEAQVTGALPLTFLAEQIQFTLPQ